MKGIPMNPQNMLACAAIAVLTASGSCTLADATPIESSAGELSISHVEAATGAIWLVTAEKSDSYIRSSHAQPQVQATTVPSGRHDQDRHRSRRHHRRHHR
jgi:hypothetical protein